MNLRRIFVLTMIILVSIVSIIAVAIYVSLPHPDVVEVVPNHDFYSGDGHAQYTNVTVIVRNNGASGWVKVIAIYQVDFDRMDEKSQVIYLPSGETREVIFTRITGKYIDGDYLRFPQMSTARAELAWTSQG